jgi:hypothetical protein
MIRMPIFTSLLLCLLLLAVPGDGPAEQRIDLGVWTSAEDGRLPGGWRLLTFPSISAATNYEVVPDPVYGQVVEAQSSEGAGGIGRSLSIDPLSYPILKWSWKIADTISGSSLWHKSGDDFPVRVMISFKSDSAGHRGLKDNILCYVWATDEPIGSVAINPIHSNIRTFVALSGSDRRGEWIEMSRNLVEDYRVAFSEEPEAVTGLVLMTDSDNTGSEAHAWYGPLWLSSDVAAPPPDPSK